MYRIRILPNSNALNEAVHLIKELKTHRVIFLESNSVESKLKINEIAGHLKERAPQIQIEFDGHAAHVYSDNIFVRFTIADSIRTGECVLYLSFLQGNREIEEPLTFSVYNLHVNSLLEVQRRIRLGEVGWKKDVNLGDKQGSGSNGIFTFFSREVEEDVYVTGINAEIVRAIKRVDTTPNFFTRTMEFITIRSEDNISQFEIVDNRNFK